MLFFACFKLYRMRAGLIGCDHGGGFMDSKGEGWGHYHARWGSCLAA
jgi:hypothetical protein